MQPHLISVEACHVDSQKARVLTRKVLWKLDIHVLPALALLWLANFTDRSNIGNAKIAGLDKDTHLHGNQFNTALAIFYLPYILIELPSNWVMKKMRPNRWLPFLVAVWGMVTTLSGLVNNFAGLVAIRFFLGLCEGGLLPGIVLYLSTLYKPHELQQRVGIFFVSASLSGAFGGLLASAIVRMDGIGGLSGWRWIFILEGIVTVLFGFIAWMMLPANLGSAKFLTKKEREFAGTLIWRFRQSTAVTADVPLSEPAQRITPQPIPVDPEKEVEEDKTGSVKNLADATTTITTTTDGAVSVHIEEEKFEWREIVRGLVDIQVWLTAIAYMGIIVPLYSFSLFLPTIVAGLGYHGSEAQLHTAPPYVPAAVLTIVVAILSDKLKWRGPFMLILLPIALIGYIIAVCAKTNLQRYVAVHLMATGLYPCGPCILSILPNNTAGHYKRATTIALQLAISNCGGFVATFAYTPDQAPAYKRGHSIALAFVSLAWVFVALNVAYCLYENKARAEGRRNSNIDKYQELWDSGKTRAPIGDRSPAFKFTL
ncbi:MFS general substrate transporter [Irpex rosettiformis]|uniref:MFS general substrate transporter n=1 Tax=Irpex rosettiformis TaxID=378272 RepID=A0ACB8UED1_9APHY|nr:MFS general substrate transporter [Irpex rosettiformis]